MTVDWVALVVLGVAYIVSLQTKISLRIRNLVFAVALFGIAGWRVYSGGVAGNNALFAGLAAAMGGWYVWRAFGRSK
jgi:hypothetical protein